MGASVSGHSSHPEHSARFNRVGGGNRSPSSRCMMCQLDVDLGAAAYRCSEPDCAAVLHEACYWRPKTLKRHFAHPKHRLTLGGDTRAGLSCSICAQELGTPPVAYSCTKSRCAGFHAHPRCCGLPPDMIAPPELKHEHANLVLRPPPPPSGGNGNRGDARRRRRRCLKCKRVAAATGRTPAPWSYQCPKCDDVEYCLACVLGNDGGRPAPCCCFPCCDVDDPAAVQCLGHLAGVFCCAFLSGMGCPVIPTQQYPGNMEPTASWYRT